MTIFDIIVFRESFFFRFDLLVKPRSRQAKVETVPSPMKKKMLEELNKDMPSGCRYVKACLGVLTPKLLQPVPNVQCNSATKIYGSTHVYSN